MHKLISRYRTWVLFVSGLLYFIYGLGNNDLKAPDEPRFALVAREMLETGDFVFPHRNERPYPDKPPLFFWTIAATSVLTGQVDAWSARLPSALAALACLYLIAFWATDGKWNGRLGISIMLVLASGLQFVQQAHNAQIDMLLCFLVLSASLLGYKKLQGEAVSQMFLGLIMGLAILTKGPVGYIIPAGSWAFYCLSSGKQSWKYYPKKALLWGLLPPLIWIACLVIQVWHEDAWSYFNNLLFKQTVVRYANPWHHHKPWYYFILAQVTGFFPWCLILPLAFPWTKNLRKLLNSKLRFAWAAYLFIFIFFSLSTGKRNLYILGLYPFCAYIVSDYLLRIKTPTMLLKGLLSFSGIIFAAVGLGLTAVSLEWIQPDILSSLEKELPKASILIFTTLIVIGGLMVIRFAFRWKQNRLPTGVFVSIFSLSILFYQVISPWNNDRRSSRNFSEQVTAVLQKSSRPTQLGMVDYRSAFRFYGTQKIEELSTFDPQAKDPKLLGLPKPEDFWSSHPDGYIIIRRKDLQEFQDKDAIFPEYVVLIDQIISNERVLLIARDDNKPS